MYVPGEKKSSGVALRVDYVWPFHCSFIYLAK